MWRWRSRGLIKPYKLWDPWQQEKESLCFFLGRWQQRKYIKYLYTYYIYIYLYNYYIILYFIILYYIITIYRHSIFDSQFFPKTFGQRWKTRPLRTANSKSLCSWTSRGPVIDMFDRFKWAVIISPRLVGLYRGLYHPVIQGSLLNNE